VLVVVDPALGAAPLAALAAAAPPGVVVVNPATAPAALSASTPRIVIRVGAPELAVGGTPRSRIGVVALPGNPVPAPPLADVLWSVSPEGAPGAWSDLAAALAAFAPGAASASPGKEPPA
jgi:hypothetical protein